MYIGDYSHNSQYGLYGNEALLLQRRTFDLGPLVGRSDLSADELAAEIERQGAAYSAYVNGFRDNGVTGEIAKEYLDGDLDELFDDLSITSKLHRKALRKLFEGLDGRARRESVASADSVKSLKSQHKRCFGLFWEKQMAGIDAPVASADLVTS